MMCFFLFTITLITYIILYHNTNYICDKQCNQTNIEYECSTRCSIMGVEFIGLHLSRKNITTSNTQKSNTQKSNKYYEPRNINNYFEFNTIYYLGENNNNYLVRYNRVKLRYVYEHYDKIQNVNMYNWYTPTVSPLIFTIDINEEDQGELKKLRKNFDENVSIKIIQNILQFGLLEIKTPIYLQKCDKFYFHNTFLTELNTTYVNVLLFGILKE